MIELQQGMPPITEDDFFALMDHHSSLFSLPAHFHQEYEIELVVDGHGNRIVGDSSEAFNGTDLVLIGPDLQHSFSSSGETGRVVTIILTKDLLDFKLLGKRIFRPIRQLLLDSRQGISFEGKDRGRICEQILELTSLEGFEAVTALLRLLDTMAHATEKKLLVKNVYESDNLVNRSKSRRIAKALAYIEKNLSSEIRLSDVATLVNMSESSFSHFFRKRTGMSYIQYVNNQRVAKACNLLSTTTMGISEICFACGFNNYSNFIRTFVGRKGMTPSEYRIFSSQNSLGISTK